MNEIVTDVIDTSFDVRKRLSRMQGWREEWQQQDHQLRAKLQHLSGSDKELGKQIGSLRKRLRLRCLREPLEFPVGLSGESYVAIRQHLVQQFATLSAEERLAWLDNFLFIMTPDLWHLHHKIERVLAYRSYGCVRH